MRNFYIYLFLFSFSILNLNAQNVIDFEDCGSNGQPYIHPAWSDWGCGGGVGCAILCSNEQNHTYGGSWSGLIPDDGTTDALLLLGDKIFGTWGFRFHMYIPSNREGYWNIQGTPVGTDWIIGNVFFNYENVNPGFGWCGYDPVKPEDVQFNFPHDEWFEIILNIDISTGMSSSTWQMYVDGVEATDGFQSFDYNGDGNYADALGSINFYSISTNNKYWLDDIEFADYFLEPYINEIEDTETIGFSAYPNPVEDLLTIKANEAISKVSIFNVLGQEVYNKNIDEKVYIIDTSNLTNGTYIVKVTIGDTVGNMKIVK